MHYFNSGFLRIYYVWGPDAHGSAIIYNVIVKSLTLRFQPNLTSFYWSPFSFCCFSLSLLLRLPFCFISLLPCGFPLFGEGQDFLLWSWLASGRSQRIWFGTGTSWSATWCREVKPRGRLKTFVLGLSWQPAGARRGAAKGSQRGPVLGCEHQGSPNHRTPPGRGWLEVALIALESPLSLLSALTCQRHPRLNPCTKQRCLLDFWLCLKAKDWNQNWVWADFHSPPGETPVIQCVLWGLCVCIFLNYKLFRESRVWHLDCYGDHINRCQEWTIKEGQELATGSRSGRGSRGRDKNPSLIHIN